jgi:hypothetical protein
VAGQWKKRVNCGEKDFLTLRVSELRIDMNNDFIKQRLNFAEKAESRFL